jgi:hypothetical protein
LTHENETPIGIHRRFLTFCGEDTVNLRTVVLLSEESRDGGGNLDLNTTIRSPEALPQ